MSIQPEAMVKQWERVTWMMNIVNTVIAPSPALDFTRRHIARKELDQYFEMVEAVLNAPHHH